jgi:hypothetical protein
MGGTDFGLRPMPGITQASIKTETRGSLKTATINIKANNRNQFDIIDVLYLRLGYSMFLEWGNSSYYNNSGGYVSNNPHCLANKFLEGEIKYDNYYIEIAKKVKESYGNYDAIVGKVVNFNWTFTKEGTYDITIILRSIGDVIESLKTNILLPGGDPVDKDNSPNTESSPNPTPEETIKDFANAHEIGKKFYKLQKQLEPLGDGGGGISKIRDTTTNDVIAFKQIYEKGSPAQYYVRLGYFLDFIKSTIIPYVDKKEIPLIDIDTDIKSNIIYLVADQVSTNPNICVFKKNYTTNLGRIAIITPGVNDFITTVPKSNDSPTTVKNSKNTYGRIMNIYFNMTWILTQMKNLKNTDGKVPLYDLLTALCNGWNTSTGNFNKLEVTVDNEEGIIRFIDEVPLPDRDSWLKTIPGASTELASFDVYGYYYGQGNDGYTKGQSHAGFIKDISFNTTIPSSLATMITVGATSNGYVVGQDSTALSRMNSGFVDRFKEKIETHQDTKTVGTGSLNDNYASALNSFQTFLSQLGSINNNTPTWNQEAINSFSNTAVTFYEYDQAKQTLEAAGLSAASASNAALNNNFSALASSPSSPSIGFLPFDLSLTMDGLSGMKVYQKYIADASFLPSNYPSSLEFIIKGITNTISNNEWVTTLESIATPKNPFGSSLGENAVVAGSNRDASRGTSPVITNCGLRVLLNPPALNNPTSAKRIDAIKKAYNATFKNGEAYKPGKCARYTYNHAYNYTQALKGGALKNGANQPAGGNAKQNVYWSYLVKLGYTQTQIGKNITKEELKTFINSDNFNIGDILVYWGNGNTNLSGVKYGHTQLYTGGYVEAGVKWTSDRYINYNTGFVYNRDETNCYNLILFRAPNV